MSDDDCVYRFRLGLVDMNMFMFMNIFGRPFVKRCYQTVVCLSVLSVKLVYCGQTVGWIKMKLDMQVGVSLATLC